MSVNYSIVPYPDADDKQQIIDWLSGYDFHVNQHTTIGSFPKIDDFLGVVNSLPECICKIQSTFFGFIVEISCDDWVAEFAVWEYQNVITHLTYNGYWKIGEIVMSKLAKQYGSFIILADGEPEMLINAES